MRLIPLYIYRVILTQFRTLVPELKVDVCRPEGDFDAVIYAVVLLARVPPVAVFKFEKSEGERG